jgi:hypothetical protein
MMRTRALVMSTETVTQVTTLRRRARRLCTVFSVRRRVNPYSVFVDVRAVLNKLRFARRGRRCVRMDYYRRNQGQCQDDLCENFQVDFPCLYPCHAPLSQRLSVIQPAPQPEGSGVSNILTALTHFSHRCSGTGSAFRLTTDQCRASLRSPLKQTLGRDSKLYM